MALAFVLVDRRDRIRCASTIFAAGMIFLVALAIINTNYPFAGGGDDRNYYLNSRYEFRGLGDWFDFSRVNRRQEQGGYALLLAWVHQFVGDSLFLRKAVNILFFLILGVVWYAIGMAISGRRLAWVFFTMVLATSPLWYYWMFLLKDMAIVLLQSIFLLGAVKMFTSGKIWQSVAVVVSSTLLLIPFRVYLVLVNLAVLLFGVLFVSDSCKKRSPTFLRVLIVLVMTAGILSLGANRDFLKQMGAGGERRALDAVSIEESLANLGEAKQHQLRSDRTYALKYPLLFLIGETTGLNPHTYKEIEAKDIRGILVVPWLLFGVPLFGIGVRRIVAVRGKKKVHSIRKERIQDVSKPSHVCNERVLWLLLAFIALYSVISWISTDTTRWRMPVMPMMVGVAGWGWLSLSPYRRVLLIGAWSGALILFTAGYYLTVK